MRLLFAKLRAHGWARSSVWQFVFKLFGHGLIHTKTTQEDVLQHLQNLTRASRNTDTRMTRTFYTEATAERLRATGDVAMLTLQPGCLRLHGDSHKITNDCFRARKTATSGQPVAEDVVVASTIAELKSGKQARAPELDFT